MNDARNNGKPTESEAARTARDRLEQTRRELMRHMTREEGGRTEGGDSPGAGSARMHARPHDMDRGGPAAEDDYYYDDEPGAQGSHASDDEGLSGTWQSIRQTATAWWRSHPAHLALEVAEPVFEKYARSHPVRVLGISAAVGAALVIARPWRLISVTGLLVAAVKSTQLSALASAMLRPKSSESMRRHETERAREQIREHWRQEQAAARERDRFH